MMPTIRPIPFRRRPEDRLGVPRFWEIDLLRGAALVNMALFHLVFDLHYFGSLDVDMGRWPWLWQARLGAAAFVAIAGISAHLRVSRMPAPGRISRHLDLPGGAVVLGWGVAISLSTWAVMDEGYVVFGALHLIGLCILLSPALLRLGRWTLPAGAAAIAAGFAIEGVRVGGPWLVWLGLRPEGFTSVDHTPVLPWLGVFLLGSAAGRFFYPEGRRRYLLPDLPERRPLAAVTFLGRNSLLFYLVHQPVMLVCLHSVGLIDLTGRLASPL